ncbi:hypothetical protein EVAR_37321_1 [Eumeta japonica]|uniref:Uncharacterized protein n=1 Tax=Eumeta variegata TaxID=151549 RepID=A0A4C1WXH6_EUMVA|nr:hypothetical protein EVAR_37321_1 [Eumeta japonica]
MAGENAFGAALFHFHCHIADDAISVCAPAPAPITLIKPAATRPPADARCSNKTVLEVRENSRLHSAAEMETRDGVPRAKVRWSTIV